MRVSGVSYEINWRAFAKGKSMFFPCLDYDRARKEVTLVTDRLGLNIVSKGCVDPKYGVKGLRIWRV